MKKLYMLMLGGAFLAGCAPLDHGHYESGPVDLYGDAGHGSYVDTSGCAIDPCSSGSGYPVPISEPLLHPAPYVSEAPRVVSAPYIHDASVHQPSVIHGGPYVQEAPQYHGGGYTHDAGPLHSVPPIHQAQGPYIHEAPAPHYRPTHLTPAVATEYVDAAPLVTPLPIARPFEHRPDPIYDQLPARYSDHAPAPIHVESAPAQLHVEHRPAPVYHEIAEAHAPHPVIAATSASEQRLQAPPIHIQGPTVHVNAPPVYADGFGGMPPFGHGAPAYPTPYGYGAPSFGQAPGIPQQAYGGAVPANLFGGAGANMECGYSCRPKVF